MQQIELVHKEGARGRYIVRKWFFGGTWLNFQALFGLSRCRSRTRHLVDLLSPVWFEQMQNQFTSLYIRETYNMGCCSEVKYFPVTQIQLISVYDSLLVIINVTSIPTVTNSSFMSLNENQLYTTGQTAKIIQKRKNQKERGQAGVTYQLQLI